MMRKIATTILSTMLLGIGATIYAYGRNITSLEKDALHHQSRIDKIEKRHDNISGKIDQLKTDVLNQQKNMYDNFLKLYQRKK